MSETEARGLFGLHETFADGGGHEARMAGGRAGV
jgi:hypothetical protein